jgi:hypothetical protein
MLSQKPIPPPRARSIESFQNEEETSYFTQEVIFLIGIQALILALFISYFQCKNKL